MNSNFKKIIKNLQQQKVSITDFYSYLAFYRKKSSYRKLTKQLKLQNIDLKKFLKFLNVLDSKEISPEARQRSEFLLEKIGIKLLAASKIDMNDLNSLLNEIPKESLSHRTLLQKLLSQRKIKIQDFIELEQGDWTEILNSPYQLQRSAKGLAFYFQQKEQKKIGPYQVLEELGRGGMGIVFKAYHRKLNRTVALKVLHEGADFDKTKLKRFHREIKTMAKLSHPGLLEIFESGQEGHKHYFSMEYMDGLTLEQVIPLPLREAFSLIHTNLTALQYTHEQGIIHRDLKPENIFVSQEGITKIGDFGLAKDLDLSTKSQKLTQSGAVLGTAYYMSPEQARGDIKNIDARSDLYSLGVCLYQLLTNKKPFEATNLQKLLHKIIYEEPISPTKYLADLHQDVEIIILKALEKTPAKRYQSATEFARDLERFLNGYPILAKKKSYPEKIKKWLFRNKFSVFLVSLILFCSLSFLLFLQWSKFQSREKQFALIFIESIAQRKEAESIKSQGFEARGKKMTLFLSAFNSINQALQYEIGKRKTEQQKWEIGKRLVQFACDGKDYGFANYIAQDLQQLTIIPPAEKKQLLATIHKAKAESENKNLNKLNQWIFKLKHSTFSKTQQKDAIFEMSRMTEELVFNKLVSLLEEGLSYFLSDNNREKQLDQFYLTTTLALGRQENQKAGPVLLNALKKMEQKIHILPVAQQPLSDIQYMVALADGLGFSKMKNLSGTLHQIRWKLGIYGVFWDGTELVYRKIVRLDNAHKANASTSKEFYERGVAKEALKDFAGAEEDYSQAILRDSENEELYHFRGVARVELRNMKGALDDFSQAIRVNPNYALAYSSRGVVKYRKGDLNGGIEDYSKALRLDPELAFAYANRGFANFDKNNIAGAIADFTEALKLNPQFSKVYNSRGLAYKKIQKYSLAFNDYSEAIGLNPKFAFAYANRGEIQAMMNHLDASVADYTQAILLNPKLEKAYNARGLVKKALKDFEGAIQDFDAAIRIKPDFVYAYGNRGDTKSAKGNYQGAIEDYTLAIRKNPELVMAFNNRGLAHKALKNHYGAIEDFTKAIEINPIFVEALNNRGMSKYALGDPEGAILDYNQALKIRPQEANVYLNRGTSRLKIGDRAKARADFQRYFELTKNSKDPQINNAKFMILKLFPELK